MPSRRKRAVGEEGLESQDSRLQGCGVVLLPQHKLWLNCAFTETFLCRQCPQTRRLNCCLCQGERPRETEDKVYETGQLTALGVEHCEDLFLLRV